MRRIRELTGNARIGRDGVARPGPSREPRRVPCGRAHRLPPDPRLRLGSRGGVDRLHLRVTRENLDALRGYTCDHGRRRYLGRDDLATAAANQRLHVVDVCGGAIGGWLQLLDRGLVARLRPQSARLLRLGDPSRVIGRRTTRAREGIQLELLLDIRGGSCGEKRLIPKQQAHPQHPSRTHQARIDTPLGPGLRAWKRRLNARAACAGGGRASSRGDGRGNDPASGKHRADGSPHPLSRGRCEVAFLHVQSHIGQTAASTRDTGR